VRVCGTFAAAVLKATEVRFVTDQGDACVEVTGVVTDYALQQFKVRGMPVDVSGAGIDYRDDSARVRSPLTDFVSSADFRVAGQRVDAGAALLEPAGATLTAASEGRSVGAEGSMVARVLKATKLHLRCPQPARPFAPGGNPL